MLESKIKLNWEKNLKTEPECIVDWRILEPTGKLTECQKLENEFDHKVCEREKKNTINGMKHSNNNKWNHFQKNEHTKK